MDGSGADRSGVGHDGTQPPPPPPLFPDPLSGLVTGELPYRPPEVVVVPVVTPPPPDPVQVPPPARATAARRPAQPRRPDRQVSGEPAAHVPHAELSRRQPKQAPVEPAPGPQPPKKGKAGLIGCLVVLAALSGLLFNVVREIIEAVVDLVR